MVLCSAERARGKKSRNESVNMIQKGLGLYMENRNTKQRGNTADKKMPRGTQENQELSYRYHASGHIGNNLIFISLHL